MRLQLTVSAIVLLTRGRIHAILARRRGNGGLVKLRKRRVAISLAIVLGIAVASLSVSAASGGSDAKSAKGGTYRVGWESTFGWTDSFDPTGEYLANGFAIYSNLLLRGLVGFNHVAGPKGNIVVPDLATKVPKPTNGGKTYTFKLKNGIKWGPPLNREITSKDVRYAIERMARPKNGAQYSFYFNVIKGFEAYGNGKSKSIAGIRTPNAKTVVFTLTSPAGDFPQRLTMPAAFPMPQEVAKCFDGKPGQYGRYVIASGPYMIEGSDKLNISSCKTLKPISGYDGKTKLNFVRNPNYNAKTDSPKARENNPDRFEFTVDSNLDDIYNKVAAGDLEDEYATASPKVFREYSTDPAKRSRLKSYSGDQTYYITMNLTQPPFDDVHVRRAMNWVMDRNALRKAWGGPIAGSVAQHVIPNPMLLGKLNGYQPFKTAGDLGNATKAKAEMRKSKYATNNGVCTAKECKGVLLIQDVRTADKAILPAVQASAAKIGITFTVRTINGAYPVIQTPSKNIPISTRPRWGKDYADPFTFIDPLFKGTNIIPSGNTNYALVGITPKQAKQLGVTGNVKNVPSIDAAADRCAAKVGVPRINCYAAIDKTLTTKVVAWVPYLWANQVNVLGPKVAKWTFDQAAGLAGFAHVAVKQ
jgi:peptide/nickel transport system substrate-binding protein